MSRPRAAPLQVELSRSVGAWLPPQRLVARWARAACGVRGHGRELSVHVVSRSRSRELNARYRGRNRPTNVLSFAPPASPGQTGSQSAALGELVVCAAVLRSEAAAQRKPLLAHWAHMIVHGSLHLLGYDHEQPRDARRMERCEIDTLGALGVADPYKVLEHG